jgi:hypothetical protein
VADDARPALLADLLGRVAGCFPRRETRQCCSQMVRGLLMELDDYTCQPVAGAAGHRGPHRLQHLRDTVIPPPRRDRPAGCTGRPGDAATSTAPAKPTSAGTPTPRQHHDHSELQPRS